MRPSATIVLHARNGWEATRACLETLRPTLGVRDQVVVVADGSADGSAASLARYGWVRMVDHQQSLNSAAARNDGVAVATGDVLVFLDTTTLLPARWLDALLAPFADATVGAVGPRSNAATGPQQVPGLSYDADRTAEMQRFARLWRQEHRGQTTDVSRLDAFCIAVRRTLFDQVGGFDVTSGTSEQDFCACLAESGSRMVIAHESFVHRHDRSLTTADGAERSLRPASADHKPAGRKAGARHDSAAGPLLSACMIVKDEEANLPQCLASLDGVADEIVIYDTGSTDRTIEIARAAGATVIEGYWDDDFGRARNVALDACQGTWVLQIDADELVEGAVGTIRRQLRAPNAPEVLNVSIGNVGDDGQVGYWHKTVRLFQRGVARWSGRLHEQLVPTSGTGVFTGEDAALRLRHTGYTTDAITRLGKMERNLRVAEQEARDGNVTDVGLVINLARSLHGAGRLEEALEQFRLARSFEPTPPPTLRRNGLRFGSELLLQIGRPEEALEWIDELRQVSSSSSMTDHLEGVARLHLGDAAGALRCFERVDEAADVADEETRVPAHLVAVRRGFALIVNEKWLEAVQVLTSAFDGPLRHSAPWNLLVEAYFRAGLPLEDMVALDPEVPTVRLLGLAAKASTESGHALASHLWERGREEDRLALVAFLRRLASELSLQDTLVWSVRLRTVGLASECPLADFAMQVDRPVLERLQAAAVLAAVAQDPRGVHAMTAVTQDVDGADIRAALVALDDVAPALLPTFVAELAADRRRVPAVVGALTELGATEQAQLLRDTYAA